MPVAAYVSHRLPGRARLKIPSQLRSLGFFQRLREDLRSCPGILELQCKPGTASLLILHDPAVALESILDYARDHGLFECTDPSPAPMMAPPKKLPSIAALASQGANLVDSGLDGASRGLVNLSSLYLLACLGLGARELMRGNIMPPALTLLWYSFEILKNADTNPN